MTILTEYAAVFAITVPTSVAAGAAIGSALHDYLTTIAVACQAAGAG